MQTRSTVKALRNAVKAAKQEGKKISFVPTMGNLHEGHLQLVRRAKAVSDFVVVSIYINPLQFGAGEDLDNYPRTLSADKQKLFAEGTDLLFTPSTEEMYPNINAAPPTVVSVPKISETLCGQNRPGHFAGVATVVSKLFNMVQPEIAIFGKKDFQQLLVIRKMVEDLCLPIEIMGVTTARAEDGLALSSRNGYLNENERDIAPRLHRILLDYRDAIASGFDNYPDLQRYGTEDLRQAGFEPDYFSIRDAKTLEDITVDTEEAVIAVAANLGATRLIDNTTLAINPSSDWGMLASQ
jgi:pantoate--beta-alanine ligase